MVFTRAAVVAAAALTLAACTESATPPAVSAEEAGDGEVALTDLELPVGTLAGEPDEPDAPEDLAAATLGAAGADQARCPVWERYPRRRVTEVDAAGAFQRGADGRPDAMIVVVPLNADRDVASVFLTAAWRRDGRLRPGRYTLTWDRLVNSRAGGSFRIQARPDRAGLDFAEYAAWRFTVDLAEASPTRLRGVVRAARLRQLGSGPRAEGFEGTCGTDVGAIRFDLALGAEPEPDLLREVEARAQPARVHARTRPPTDAGAPSVPWR
jgi:hypothetical protein